jgi:hypothetical protein
VSAPFDALQEELLRAGVAPRHVRRYLCQLSDHLADLTQQQLAAGNDPEDAAIRAHTILGDDAELAAAMKAEPRLRSLSARAPWAVFGLLPPFAALAIMMVPTGLLILISRHFGFLTRHAPPPPEWFQVLAQSVVTASNILLVPLAAVLFVGIAFRQRLGLSWPLIATALLLLLFVHSEVSFPLPGHYGNSLSIGFAPIFLSNAWRTITAQWPVVTAQYLLTLWPALWLIRTRQRQKVLP